MSGNRPGIRLQVLAAGLGLSLVGTIAFAQDAPPQTTVPKTKARKNAGKGGAKRGDAAPKTEAKAMEPETGTVFSRDVAPILVGNCIGCHKPSAKERNGGLDLTTFQGLMAGGKSGEVVVAGDPEASPLVVMVATQEMPRGNRGKLSEEAVGRIRQWVQGGAVADAKTDPLAPLDKVAASPEDIRRNEMAKLSPEARDKKLEEVALERWKQASSKVVPIASPGKNFLVFGNLPKERVDKLLKTMEGQRQKLGGLLGHEGAKALAGPEKVSLYVFNDPANYVEFVRSVENREVEAGTEFHGRLDVEHPYVAAVDPLNGGPESSSKKSGRSRKVKGEEEPDGPDRSLEGLLTDGLASSAVSAAGKPPRWLSSGLGAYFASQVDARSGNATRKLRETARQQFELGWITKANEAMGGEGSPETIRALGFSLCECLAMTSRGQFPSFVQDMIQGGENLDDAIRGCFGDQISREMFLENWGSFIANQYGSGRRR